jgi:predicted TIM-barrel fold metal-dependent hydrolase/ketosteroid isomerase-like protein
MRGVTWGARFLGVGLLVAGALGGCASTGAAAGTQAAQAAPAAECPPPAAAAAPARKAPRVDHHQHLMSPEAVKRVAAEVPEAVPVPAALAPLLKAREAKWNDAAGLAALLTEDALLLNQNGPDAEWVQGRKDVSEQVGTRFARPYRITPIAASVEGRAGEVAGFFSRDGEGGVKHFGHVMMTLRQGRDGAWRIAREAWHFPGPRDFLPIPAEGVLAQLDEAGVEKAAVLSVAYWFGSPLMPPVPDEYARVKAENDWNVAETQRVGGGRLVPFCSFNPLKDYALEELTRCSKLPGVKGLKFHFGNSGVDVLKAEHLERVRRVFQAADAAGLAIVAHLWTLDRAYGRPHAEAFLRELLPAAPNVPVQVAHFAGGGPGYTDEALAVFAEARQAKDPRTKNLWLDVATVADQQPPAVLQKLAERIRQVGVDRVLFGTDASPPNPPVRQAWLTFRTTVPLTDAELDAIAGNVLPVLR